MDPASAHHISIARLEMRVDVLDRSDARQETAIERLDNRQDASEKREVAMNAALQELVEARKLLNGAAITQLVGVGIALFLLVPVVLDRSNSHNPAKPPLVLSK